MADSPLQKSPLGLLGLYELKTLGDAPSMFGGAVQPSADVNDVYMLDRQIVDRSSTVIAAPGQTSTRRITLQQRQYFYLRGVSGQIVTDAADVAIDSLQCVWVEAPDGSPHFLDSINVHTQATAFRACGVTFPPFFLSPGWSIVAYAELVTAPAGAWTHVLQALGSLITE